MYRADVPEDPRVLDVDFGKPCPTVEGLQAHRDLVQQGKGKGRELSTLIRAASETSDCDEIPGDDGMQPTYLSTLVTHCQNSVRSGR